MGSASFNAVRAVDNYLLTVASDGVYKWTVTKVFDERSVTFLSAPITKSEPVGFWRGVSVMDSRRTGEMWYSCGGDVIVYSYRLGVWYRYSGINPSLFWVIDGNAGYCKGTVAYIMDEGVSDDDGEPFQAFWESAYSDLGTPQYIKNITRLFVSSEAQTTAVGVTLENDNGVTAVSDISNDSDTPATITRRLNMTRCKYVKTRIALNAGVPEAAVSGIKLAWVECGERR
jgi:hypothetical protein